MKLISSPANPLIKEVIRHSTLIEGTRELSLAIQARVEINILFWCREICSEETLSSLVTLTPKPPEIIEVSVNVYNKLAYRDNSGGLIATINPYRLTLSQIKLSEKPLIVVLENVEKPGNIGAILRTADAAHVDAVFLCDSRSDIYSPNVIRASLGSIFTNQVVCCTSEEAIAWLKEMGIGIYSTYLETNNNYANMDFKQSSAIVMGSEAHGITQKWQDSSDKLIKIPMFGQVDSMNVSTATAVIVFEALRQRTS